MIRLLPLKIPVRQISTNKGNCRVKSKPSYGPVILQNSTLSSGIKIAAARTQGSSMGSCTILFQAGSRYETSDDLGANHFLRIASSASGLAYTKFAKSHVLQQHGAALTCTSDRETIAYTLRCPVAYFPKLKGYLTDTAARCCYHNWEIQDLRSVVNQSLIRMNPERRVLDLVQKACWGGPLSNSIFCDPERLDSITGKSLVNFADQNFVAEKCTVGSVGIPFQTTMKIAEMIEGRRFNPKNPCGRRSFPRRGYEVEDLGPNSTTWIAVAVPGFGSCDFQSMVMSNIVAAAAGIGHMQMGMHDEDRVPSSPLGTMAGPDVNTSYKAFSISYLDTGVFGVLAKTRACSAWQVTLAAAEFLTNIGDLSLNQIEIGKQRLNLGLSLIDEDCVNLSESLALQALSNLKINDTFEAINMINACAADTVSMVAKKISLQSCNMALAVVGDIGRVPHDGEITRCRPC